MYFVEHFLPGAAVITSLHLHKPVIICNLSQLISSEFIWRVQCDCSHTAGHAFAGGCYFVRSQRNCGIDGVAGRRAAEAEQELSQPAAVTLPSGWATEGTQFHENFHTSHNSDKM